MIKKEKKPNNKPAFNNYWIYGALIVFFIAVNFIGVGSNNPSNNQINPSTFEKFLNNGDVSRIVVINKNKAQVTLTNEAFLSPKHNEINNPDFFGRSNSKGPHYEFEIGNLELFQKKLEAAANEGIIFSYEFKTIESKWLDILQSFLPLIIIIAVWIFIMRRMSAGGAGGGGAQIFNIGKSKAKLFDQNSNVKINFKDVAGLEGAKEEVQEIVDFLKNPLKYTKLGGKIPKGALLVGPPGTGKTMIAKAVATETNAHFKSINGPEIISKYYGESEKQLREIFDDASDNAPAIIFIDEIDSICPKREDVSGEVERRVVAQMLTLMDGMQGRDNVVVIGATNRRDALDPALRRPGRFDREIEIGVPDRDGRSEIMDVHTRQMPMSEDFDITWILDNTYGFVGADLAALVREAAMKALRRYLPEIDLDEDTIPPEVLEKMEV